MHCDEFRRLTIDDPRGKLVPAAQEAVREHSQDCIPCRGWLTTLAGQPDRMALIVETIDALARRLPPTLDVHDPDFARYVSAWTEAFPSWTSERLADALCIALSAWMREQRWPVSRSPIKPRQAHFWLLASELYGDAASSNFHALSPSTQNR